MIHYMPCSPHAQGKCMAEIFGNKIKFKQEIALASWQFETKLWTAHSFKTCWLHCSGNHFTPLCYFKCLWWKPPRRALQLPQGQVNWQSWPNWGKYSSNKQICIGNDSAKHQRWGVTWAHYCKEYEGRMQSCYGTDEWLWPIVAGTQAAWCGW